MVNKGFSAAGATDGAPAYEFVPDDVYDAYAPDAQDDAPEPSPQGAAVAALRGASKNPVPAPTPEGTALPWEAPKPAAPATSAEGTDGQAMLSFSAPDDPAAIELAQMLSAAFGGYVKVSHDS